MKYRHIFLFVLFQFINYNIFGQLKTDDIIGTWLTGGNQPAKIQIFKSDNTYFGKIVWLQNPLENNKPIADVNNPDKTKRNQGIIGLMILKGFRFDGDDEWKGGKIYDPENGKTYNCILSLIEKNTLNVRGYVGISMFGRNEEWTRTTP